MDPISHAALGRTLAAVDVRRRLGAGAAAACVLGALCPDLDIARTLQGWDVYLVHHQSGTHSLFGAIGCGVLTGTVVRIFARRGRWLLLVAAGTIGTLSHVLLDLVSGADVKLFAPFSSRVFSLPLFAMADPWLLGALVAGAGAATIAGHRGRISALGLVAVCLSAKTLLYVRATTIERRTAPPGTTTHVEAVFGSWTRWRYIETHANTIERWDVDVGTSTVSRSAAIDRDLDTTFARRSVELPPVANLLASHDDTFARIKSDPDGRREVRWSAFRYCEVTAPASEPVCGLWFGGEYDARGHAISAIVRVGSLVQRRSPGGSAADHE